MKCFFALALVGLLASAAAEDWSHEIIETRESCSPPARAAGACRREIIKRERCSVVGGKQICTKIEDEDHEILTTREGCRIVGAQKICTREVLKREVCRPNPHMPRCRRAMTPLEGCKGNHPVCKRALLDAEERAAVMDGKIHVDEYEEVVMREMCSPPAKAAKACKREIVERNVCQPKPNGIIMCIPKRAEDEDIIVTRETCGNPAAKLGGACKREVIKRERCKECRITRSLE